MCLVFGHPGYTVVNIWTGRWCHGMLSLQVVTIVVGAVCGKCCLYCACPVQSFCVTNMFVLCVRWGGRGMGSKEEEEKEAEQKV